MADQNQFVKDMTGTQVQKRFCMNCGNQYTVGQKFCSKCGNKLPQPSVSSQPPVSPQTSIPPQPPMPPQPPVPPIAPASAATRQQPVAHQVSTPPADEPSIAMKEFDDAMKAAQYAASIASEWLLPNGFIVSVTGLFPIMMGLQSVYVKTDEADTTFDDECFVVDEFGGIGFYNRAANTVYMYALASDRKTHFAWIDEKTTGK